MTDPITTIASSPPKTDPPDEERVLALLMQWEADCAHFSSSTRRRNHPALQELVALGTVGVPSLIRYYLRAPRSIEGVLRKITGAAPSEGLETFEEWRASWIGWARARDLPV